MPDKFNGSSEVFLKVGREVPEQDVNIAFYKTPEVTVENNIEIINQSVSMNDNINNNSDMVCYVDEGYKLFYNIYGDSDDFVDTFYSKDFSLTDITIDGEAVFFRHKLRYIHLDTEFEQVEKNIDIIDEGRDSIDERYFYKLDIKELPGQTNNKNRYEITIYLNFKPDEQFKIIYNPENKKLNNYEEILNPVEIYQRVSANDFYENRLNTNDKVYAIENRRNGFAIMVPIKAIMQIVNDDDSVRTEEYLSSNNFIYDTKKFFLSFNDSTSKIYASVNKNLRKNDSWHIDINRDSFVDNKIDRLYIYEIPEFLYQDIYWIDGYPCMKYFEEEVSVVDEHTVELKNAPLFIKTETNEEGIKVPSNISLKDTAGNEYTVKNWDIENGLLYVDENIIYKKIIADYVVRQNKFKYRGYYDENGQFIQLDINPRSGHFYSTKDIKNGGAVTHNIPSYKLTSKMISIYLKPEYVIDGNEIITRNGETLFHTINNDIHISQNHPMINSDIENNYYSYEDVKLISRVFIVPITNPEKLEVTDTRTRGGGIKEKLIKEVKKIDRNAEFYWDIGKWNGKSYPSNGVVVIELPEEVLERFTHNEIVARVEKQVALGVLPVIEYV
jgi:hypothetical protein